MSTQLLQMIARLRRTLPRNSDVAGVCAALEERLLASIVKPVEREPISAAKMNVAANRSPPESRRDYMARYMREKRAKTKTEGRTS